MKRYLLEAILEDLLKKMVFVGGPRQVGKTTLAKEIMQAKKISTSSYLNWDFQQDRTKLLAADFQKNEHFIIMDEIHKYKQWRNLVKGLFDKHKGEKQFLITGSARLDFFRRGGDSLQGRYFYYRLHPLSLFEINPKPTKTDLEGLLKFGGFPEPFLAKSERDWSRWQNDHRQRVIQEDLVSLEKVSEVSQLDLLTTLLPSKVGSLISVSNLANDLHVSFPTVERWIQILERLYFCFRVQAFGFTQIRAAKKEKKLYLWDWSVIDNIGAKFENLVASNLLKYCHWRRDYHGEELDLRFLRDSNKREVDFVVMNKGKALFAVECKTGEKNVSDSIRYFSKVLPIPKYFQVHMGTGHKEVKEFKTEIIPFLEFVKNLKV